MGHGQGRAWRHLALELNNLTDAVVSEFAFGLDETFALLSRAVVKATVDFALLVLQRHVARQNEALFRALFHIRVARPVIEDKTFHAHALHVTLVLHAHDFYHVQIDGLVRNTDGLDGVYYQLRQVVRELGVHLGAKSSLGQLQKKRALGKIFLDCDTLKERM